MVVDTAPRPRQYWDDYASRFKNRSVADAYELRPPYPDETYEILRELLGESPGRVLDVGCGPGKIARILVDYVDGVDAVDFSEEMIVAGNSLANGNHPRLQWIHGRVEEVEWSPPYAMVTAGASIHWMEWRDVFPRFRKAMPDGGYVVIIDGDRPVEPPWREAELVLIREFSTNPHYEDIDLILELEERGHILPLGDRLTEPVYFSQSIRDYVGSFHSRESMSVEHMGVENAAVFDAELTSILRDYAHDGGTLSFDLQTRVSWGRPLG
ncbi:MAG: class I SAM-dependent methyltransferase [Gemmatimonadota bacterium]|nr:class I SAM-dependent methyltransferase [Gemmatimonadota bacterium]